jgi:hypothetical protein
MKTATISDKKVTCNLIGTLQTEPILREYFIRAHYAEPFSRLFARESALFVAVVCTGKA